MDYQIFQIINSLAGRNPALDYFFIFLSTYLIFVLCVIAIYWVFKQHIKKRVLVGLVLAVGWAYVTNYLISTIYFRPRPFVSHEVVKLINVSADQKSFPSDHAALAFAVAVYIFLHSRKTGLILIGMAALVALGRVLAGVHFPADILAGALVGSFFALVSKRLHHKHP